MIKNLLDIDNLNIKFFSDQEIVDAVRNVCITLRSGEVLGIVGESGAGKSTIGNAIVNLLDAPGEIVKGKVMFEGQNLVDLDDKAMRICLLYTSPSPRDVEESRMPSSA